MQDAIANCRQCSDHCCWPCDSRLPHLYETKRFSQDSALQNPTSEICSSCKTVGLGSGHTSADRLTKWRRAALCKVPAFRNFSWRCLTCSSANCRSSGDTRWVTNCRSGDTLSHQLSLRSSGDTRWVTNCRSSGDTRWVTNCRSSGDTR